MDDPDPKANELQMVVVGLFLLIAGLTAFVVVFAVAALLGGLVVQQFHAPLTDRSLARSVAVEAESAFVDSEVNECKPKGSLSWICDVSDRSGSGSYVYRVTRVGPSSCWNAVLKTDGGETPGKQRMNGCVNRFEGGWSRVILG